MEIKIVELGIGFEIRFIINGIKSFTHIGFDYEEDARKYLEEHGLAETT